MKRLDHDANTQKEVINYFQTRARQLLVDGFIWQKDIMPAPGGILTSFKKDEEILNLIMFLNLNEAKGYSSKVIGAIPERIVTVPDCQIEDFLKAKKKPYVLAGHFTESIEYKAIQEFYNDKKAERSQCYLMNHIDEALVVMSYFNASDVAKKAFCIHPLVQNSQDLAANWKSVKDKFSSEVLGLAMEYRNIANAYLSHRQINNIDEIELSPIDDVNIMLIGDKVQNYKDFLGYHYGTHPRSQLLDEYFKNWLLKLNVSQSSFNELTEQLNMIEI